METCGLTISLEDSNLSPCNLVLCQPALLREYWKQFWAWRLGWNVDDTEAGWLSFHLRRKWILPFQRHGVICFDLFVKAHVHANCFFENSDQHCFETNREVLLRTEQIETSVQCHSHLVPTSGYQLTFMTTLILSNYIQHKLVHVLIPSSLLIVSDVLKNDPLNIFRKPCNHWRTHWGGETNKQTNK